MNVLVLIDHTEEGLTPAALATITAARKLGEVSALCIGSGVKGLGEEVAALDGVGKVLLGEDPGFENPLPEQVAHLVLELMPDYETFVAADSSQGKSVAPYVAARLDLMQISDVVAIDGETFTRPVYAGNALVTLKSKDPKKVMTIRSTAFEKAEAGQSRAPVEAVTFQKKEGKSHFVARNERTTQGPELSSAGIIVSGGRALGSSEKFEAIIRPLATKIGAAVGASRAAVDAGFISNEHQVGQTGKVVAPDLYIAIGISGAIQHLAGMKDAKRIVAINNDPEAPIFQVADVGLVGDLFDVVPDLLEHL